MDAPSLELAVAPSVRSGPPIVAMSGRAPLRAVERPPGRTLPPLELAVAWERRVGAVLALFAVAFTVGAAQAARLGKGLGSTLVAGILAALATWGALAFTLNNTLVQVKRGRLLVRHTPVPVPGNKEVDVDQVRQVFVRTVFGTRRKHRWMGVWSPSEEFIVYSVHADVGDQEITLFSRIEDVSRARGFEQRLESHIGITDDPMRSLSERRS